MKNIIEPCIRCNSRNVIKWSTLKNGNQRWRCKDCKKTFNSKTKLNLPKTKLPFEFICLILYKIENKNLGMRLMLRYVNGLLKLQNFPFKKKGVSLSTLYRWKNDYGDIYKEKVSKKEAEKYLNSFLPKEKINKLSEENDLYDVKEKTVWVEEIYDKKLSQKRKIPYLSHKDLLKLLINIAGREHVIDILNKWNKSRKTKKDLIIRKNKDKVKCEIIKWNDRFEKARSFNKWTKDDDVKLILTKDKSVYSKETYIKRVFKDVTKKSIITI